MTDSNIQEYEQMTGEILALGSAIEAKEFVDKAEALRAYQRKQGADLEMQNHFGEMVARGKRRLGELIQAGQANGTIADRGGDKKSKSHDATLILKHE